MLRYQTICVVETCSVSVNKLLSGLGPPLIDSQWRLYSRYNYTFGRVKEGEIPILKLYSPPESFET